MWSMATPKGSKGGKSPDKDNKDNGKGAKPSGRKSDKHTHIVDSPREKTEPTPSPKATTSPSLQPDATSSNATQVVSIQQLISLYEQQKQQLVAFEIQLQQIGASPIPSGGASPTASPTHAAQFQLQQFQDTLQLALQKVDNNKKRNIEIFLNDSTAVLPKLVGSKLLDAPNIIERVVELSTFQTKVSNFLKATISIGSKVAPLIEKVVNTVYTIWLKAPSDSRQNINILTHISKFDTLESEEIQKVEDYFARILPSIVSGLPSYMQVETEDTNMWDATDRFIQILLNIKQHYDLHN